jgi:hypothetical protein
VSLFWVPLQFYLWLQAGQHKLARALYKQTLNLIQQIRARRDVTNIIRGQFHRGDLLRLGIDREMQLAPAPARPDAVLLIQPFARALDLGLDPTVMLVAKSGAGLLPPL